MTFAHGVNTHLPKPIRQETRIARPPLPARPQTTDDLLRASTWWQVLGDAARRHVRDHMQDVLLPQGGVLYRQGGTPRHWCGVVDGLLKWSVASAAGRSATLGGLSTGSWFGEGTLLRGEPSSADIVALRESRVALVPAETFAWLRVHERAFDDFLLRQINARMHWLMGNFAAHHLFDTDSNVARALASLFDPWLHPGGELQLQVTQEEIAQLCGLSRQRCNIALRRLADQGLVALRYGGITVTDLLALRQHASG